MKYIQWKVGIRHELKNVTNETTNNQLKETTIERSEAAQKASQSRSHESRVEGGKKAAETRGHENLSEAGRKGGEARSSANEGK